MRTSAENVFRSHENPIEILTNIIYSILKRTQTADFFNLLWDYIGFIRLIQLIKKSFVQICLSCCLTHNRNAVACYAFHTFIRMIFSLNFAFTYH